MGRTMLAVTAALALAGCGDSVELDRLSAGAHVRVAAALSGDTLKLTTGAELRLAGVEAPHGAEPYARESRALLQRLAAGQDIEKLYGGARQDPTGREVAQARLSRGRRWLEGELLRAGAVRVRTFADNRALAKRMLDIEAEARRAKRGLWASPAYQVRLPEEVTQGGEDFEVVEGRVVRVGQTGATAYLDFSQDWRRGLSVHIPRSAVDDFDLANRSLYGLQGRLIRVRGLVRDGRALWLDHPEALEVLKEP
jgi:micrococcal nuclease